MVLGLGSSLLDGVSGFKSIAPQLNNFDHESAAAAHFPLRGAGGESHSRCFRTGLCIFRMVLPAGDGEDGSHLAVSQFVCVGLSGAGLAGCLTVEPCSLLPRCDRVHVLGIRDAALPGAHLDRPHLDATAKDPGSGYLGQVFTSDLATVIRRTAAAASEHI